MNITKPQIILRLEGLAFLLVSIFGYAQLDFAWWQYPLFFLVPDIAMIFYAINMKVGSIGYNLAHTYTLALVTLVAGMVLSQPILIATGLIWLGHIGMDRMVGYGLKYTLNFKDTHLANI